MRVGVCGVVGGGFLGFGEGGFGVVPVGGKGSGYGGAYGDTGAGVHDEGCGGDRVVCVCFWQMFRQKSLGLVD